MRLIQRHSYLQKLQEALGTPEIKVLTGVRRCGKSKLLEAFIAQVQAQEPEANIIHINFNLAAYEGLTEYHALYDYVEGAYAPGVKNYLCIDEVQLCQGFEKAINNLHALEKYDIYLTGSNAFLLSSDLATLFTGRTYEIHLFPFSFQEFVAYFQLGEPNAAFSRYLQEGGMAGSYLYQTTAAKYGYLASIFDTLILRDIQQRYKLRNPAVLGRLCDFLLDNIANLTSGRSLAATLTEQKLLSNYRTVSNYLRYLCHSYAFYKVRRYDIQGRRCLLYDDKYYLGDHAFKYAKLGTKNLDLGRSLENIVALELLRRGYEVYAGVLHKREIDFVALKAGEKLYFQVAYSLEEPGTLGREVEPLLKIRDAYPKLLLSRTRQPAFQYEGVQILDVADWLLGRRDG